MKKTILLVHRAHRFSPNCVERDAEILGAILQELEARDFIVQHIDEDAITEEFLRTAPQFIISMARSKEALRWLAEWEQQEGNCVWNSAQSLLVNSRAEQTKCFALANISMPPTELLECPKSTSLRFPLWVKLGGGDAETKADVQYFPNRETLQNASFSENQTYVLSEHVEGDLLKFYGVAGTDFFFSYYPTSSTSGFSKFGLEAHNGIPQGYDYDAEALHRMAEKAAKLCGFTLYGGDCIVRPDGSFVLIDFNDFPSFAPCARDAAQAFVDSIIIASV